MIVDILIWIAGIIALFLIVAVFVRREYSIERQVTISRPYRDVFDYVRFLRNQENYSKWVRLDPNMKKSYRGVDGTVGFVYAWEGNKQAGKGEQELKKLTDYERVDIQVRFEKPFKAVAETPISTQALSADTTRVCWGMKGRYSYPMNIMNLFIDKILGKDLETSLQTLKLILEK